jgi:hypothetical protein
MAISVKNLEERLKAIETAISTKLPLAGGTMTGNISYGKTGGTLETIYSSVSGGGWWNNSGNNPSGITIKTSAAGSYAHPVIVQLVDGVKKSSLEFLNDGKWGRLYCDGVVCMDFSADNITAPLVYNAVFNDYAEFYERGEETEPGDIIALSYFSDKEVYVKASKDNNAIVGVHSDSFGHIVGGIKPPDNIDPIEYNKTNFIPVGLVGRVRTNIIGKVKKGDRIVISDDIPGVGRSFIKDKDNNNDIIGFIVDSNKEELNKDGIRRLRMQLIPWGGGHFK